MKNYVRCRICGKKFGRIAISHLATHLTTFDEYREQFPNAPLTSPATRNKHSKANRKSWARGERDHILIKLHEGVDRARKAGRYDEAMEALWAKIRQRWKDGYYDDTTLPALQKGYRKFADSIEGQEIMSKAAIKKWRDGTFSIATHNSYTGRYQGHIFRSSYELAALKYLIKRDIPFIYEPFNIDYEEGIYRPDFALFSHVGVLIVDCLLYTSDAADE